MQGWILYKRNSHELTPEDHGVIRLCEAAADQDIELIAYRPEQFDLLSSNDSESGVYIDGVLTKLPDFFIPRLGAETTYLALAVIRYLELHGVYIFNTAKSIEEVKDKLFMNQKFITAGLPAPKTMLLKLPISNNFIMREFGLPVIIKTISGARGGGVYLCDSMVSLHNLIKDLADEADAHGLIIQQFISSSYGCDLRVFVVGGQIIGCMKRIAKNGFKANYSLGGQVEPYAINDEIAYLSLAATHLFGLEITGIDLLFNSVGFTLCEANSSPGFKGMELATGVDVAAKIITHIKSKIN